MAFAAAISGCALGVSEDLAEPISELIDEPTAESVAMTDAERAAEQAADAPPEMSAEEAAESTSDEAVESHEEAAAHAVDACGPAVHGPHWAYDGADGPEHWGDLAPEYGTCGSGSTQSPIDLSNEVDMDLDNIVFDYQASELKIVNNGHTIQADYTPGSSIEVDGVPYNLLQFHFHAPSEHSIAGQLAAAELHLVHRSAECTLAVVGILIEEGAENPAFESVWANLADASAEAHVFDGTVTAADMLPPTLATFRYKGSLTTPPCSEGVAWHVMTTPIQMSPDQIAAYTAIFDGHPTNRPVQPLGDRPLIEDSTP